MDFAPSKSIRKRKTFQQQITREIRNSRKEVVQNNLSLRVRGSGKYQCVCVCVCVCARAPLVLQKTSAVRPVLAQVVGELRAADPHTFQGLCSKINVSSGVQPEAPR